MDKNRDTGGGGAGAGAGGTQGGGDPRNNRLLALVFRAAAFVACLIGVLDTTEVFRGGLNGEKLLFYTTETNVFVTAMFALLLVRTALDLKAKGTIGPSSYHERLSAIVMLSITVTMLIFWLLLAPVVPDPSFIVSYSNLQIHLVAPLLMIFDFFFFSVPGKLKRQDPWLFALIPLAYFIQATALGFSGFTYAILAKGDGQIHHFPYFFLDYYQLQGWVFAYGLAILAFFVAFAYLLLWFDHRRARRLQSTG
jgi:hypothetical protein